VKYEDYSLSIGWRSEGAPIAFRNMTLTPLKK